MRRREYQTSDVRRREPVGKLPPQGAGPCGRSTARHDLHAPDAARMGAENKCHDGGMRCRRRHAMQIERARGRQIAAAKPLPCRAVEPGGRPPDRRRRRRGGRRGAGGAIRYDGDGGRRLVGRGIDDRLGRRRRSRGLAQPPDIPDIGGPDGEIILGQARATRRGQAASVPPSAAVAPPTMTTCSRRGPCAPSSSVCSISADRDGPVTSITLRGIAPAARSRSHASS